MPLEQGLVTDSILSNIQMYTQRFQPRGTYWSPIWTSHEKRERYASL